LGGISGIDSSSSLSRVRTSVSVAVSEGEPGQLGDGQVQPRVQPAVVAQLHGRAGRQPAGQVLALGPGERPLSRALGGARLEHLAQQQHVVQLGPYPLVRAPGGRRPRGGQRVADERAAVAPETDLEVAGGLERAERLAQGDPADAEPGGQLASRRQSLPRRHDPEPDRLQQPAHGLLVGVAAAHRSEDRVVSPPDRPVQDAVQDAVHDAAPPRPHGPA
jgi:hypothetical protein